MRRYLPFCLDIRYCKPVCWPIWLVIRVSMDEHSTQLISQSTSWRMFFMRSPTSVQRLEKCMSYPSHNYITLFAIYTIYHINNTIATFPTPMPILRSTTPETHGVNQEPMSTDVPNSCSSWRRRTVTSRFFFPSVDGHIPPTSLRLLAPTLEGRSLLSPLPSFFLTWDSMVCCSRETLWMHYGWLCLSRSWRWLGVSQG